MIDGDDSAGIMQRLAPVAQKLSKIKSDLDPKTSNAIPPFSNTIYPPIKDNLAAAYRPASRISPLHHLSCVAAIFSCDASAIVSSLLELAHECWPSTLMQTQRVSSASAFFSLIAMRCKTIPQEGYQVRFGSPSALYGLEEVIPSIPIQYFLHSLCCFPLSIRKRKPFGGYRERLLHCCQRQCKCVCVLSPQDWSRPRSRESHIIGPLTRTITSMNRS